MVTIVTNIDKNSNGQVSIRTTATSATENSVASNGTVMNVAETSVQSGVLKGIALSAGLITRFIQSRDDKRFCELISQNGMDNIIAAKDTEIANLKSQLDYDQRMIENERRRYDTLNREYQDYRRNIQSTIDRLQNPQQVPQETTSSPSTIMASNTVPYAVPITLTPSGVNNNRVVLSAQVLNDAIRDKIRLEARTCSNCGNAIIAPENLHNSDIICAKCEPQGFERLLTNPFITTSSSSGPFVQYDSPYNQLFGTIQNQAIPMQELSDNEEECDGDCRNCSMEDCDGRSEDYYGWDEVDEDDD